MNNNEKYDKNSFELLEKRKWGFTIFSEKINGRVAMLGFTVLFLVELLTKHKIIDYLK
jgi:hypothetical protein